jgi:hypothetical protein
MPTIAEIPDIEVALFEDAPTPLNPLGVKGAGEAGIAASGAAIAAAVDDALGRSGTVRRALPEVRVITTPPFPQVLLDPVMQCEACTRNLRVCAKGGSDKSAGWFNGGRHCRSTRRLSSPATGYVAEEIGARPADDARRRSHSRGAFDRLSRNAGHQAEPDPPDRRSVWPLSSSTGHERRICRSTLLGDEGPLPDFRN